MGSCNYCNLQDIKRRAKQKGATVHVLKSSMDSLGGNDVFVVPKGQELDKRQPDDGGKHWVSWLMEISEVCCC